MPGEAPVNAARDANAHKTTHRAVPKGAWTKEEDDLILKSVDAYGQAWRKIAALMPTRSDDSVRNRWRRLGAAGRRKSRAGATCFIWAGRRAPGAAPPFHYSGTSHGWV